MKSMMIILLLALAPSHLLGATKPTHTSTIYSKQHANVSQTASNRAQVHIELKRIKNMFGARPVVKAR
jgi:Na+-transporting NADH:ubiquinone oxidoreductase subunit NqrB